MAVLVAGMLDLDAHKRNLDRDITVSGVSRHAAGRIDGKSARAWIRTRQVQRWGKLMRFSTLARRMLLVAMVASMAAMGPRTAGEALGQPAQQQQVCGAVGSAAPIPIGEPGPDGWVNDQESLGGATDQKRYQFHVKEPGTAYVYVGDQWYNLNLGLFSLASNTDVGCWSVDVRGTSTEAERRKVQFVRPDERAIAVEPGDYWLTVRAGDAGGFDPSRAFTVRVAVGPRVCSLLPQNVEDPTYKGMTNKPENPDIFQIGVSIQPEEAKLNQFALMSFNAYVSPPYTDLFDFTWELDGKVVPNETGATILKPYAELPKMPLGAHTVKLTVKGAREYKDPTESVYNFTPFNGESRTVTCQFRGAP
jgi:hypothetical protein